MQSSNNLRNLIKDRIRIIHWILNIRLPGFSPVNQDNRTFLYQPFQLHSLSMRNKLLECGSCHRRLDLDSFHFQYLPSPRRGQRPQNRACGSTLRPNGRQVTRYVSLFIPGPTSILLSARISVGKFRRVTNHQSVSTSYFLNTVSLVIIGKPSIWLWDTSNLSKGSRWWSGRS